MNIMVTPYSTALKRLLYERLRPRHKAGLKRIFALFACGLLLPLASAERVAFHDIFENNKRLEHELNGVNHIIQDQQGFMWFGCERGLARYDGIDTKIYRHEVGNTASLPSDIINGLLLDLNGVLWIATQSGLCFYDEQLDRFVCGHQTDPASWFEDSIQALAVDQNNILYVGTESGLYRLAADRQRFVPVPLTLSPGQSIIGVSALAVDAKNTVWIGTTAHGLMALASGGAQPHPVQLGPNHPPSTTHPKISTLTTDGEDRLWIGTHGGGLSILSADRLQVDLHVHQRNDPRSISSNVIWDILSDSAGNVWLAVDNQGGLIRFQKPNGFSILRHKPYDPASLGANQVRTIYEDKNGDLWVGLFPTGVNFHNRSTRHVQTYRHEPDNDTSLSHSAILAIFKDSHGHIWIGTEDGLNQFHPATGTFTRYSEGLPAKAVLSIEQYDEQTLWVGTWSGGLAEFDLTTRQFHPLDTRPPHSNASNSMFIWGILRDRQNNMWIATEFDGAGVYDRRSKTFRFYSRSFLGAGSLPNNYVRDLLEDRTGAIWFGTNSALAVLPPGEENPIWIMRDLANMNALQGERIFALYEDSRGWIWVGTEDKETFIYDPETTHFRPLGAEQGLPPGLIGGFIEDAHGYIWMLTTNGLVKVHSETLALQVFGAEHGLTGNHFNRNAALRDANGVLYIGGAEGLNIFDPAHLGDELHAFPVWITAMRVMNRDVQVGVGSSPLTKAISVAQEVKLDHRDLMFAFDFAGLDYRHAKDLRYAYILEGFDDHWNDVGTGRTATYTNLAAGHYRFRVKASNGKADWMESRAIDIVIQPAPWQTWWAYTLYVSLFLVAGYLAADYFRLRGHTQIFKTLSATDVLTGVANRTGLIQAAKQMFNERPAPCLCVLFMDIDHFKRINDTYGHDSGDRVLVEIADVLRQCLRQSDLLGRWGGEEFVLVWNGNDRSDAMHVAEKIRQQVAAHVFEQGHWRLNVTSSLGVAFVAPGESFESAVNRADRALYQAKEAGRNCVVVAD